MRPGRGTKHHWRLATLTMLAISISKPGKRVLDLVPSSGSSTLDHIHHRVPWVVLHVLFVRLFGAASEEPAWRRVRWSMRNMPDSPAPRVKWIDRTDSIDSVHQSTPMMSLATGRDGWDECLGNQEIVPVAWISEIEINGGSGSGSVPTQACSSEKGGPACRLSQLDVSMRHVVPCVQLTITW